MVGWEEHPEKLHGRHLHECLGVCTEKEGYSGQGIGVWKGVDMQRAWCVRNAAISLVTRVWGKSAKGVGSGVGAGLPHMVKDPVQSPFCRLPVTCWAHFPCAIWGQTWSLLSIKGLVLGTTEIINGKTFYKPTRCMLIHFSCLWLFATPWTVAHQAPLSMGFSRAATPSPSGDLPDSGMESRSLTSPALAGGLFTTSATWEAIQPYPNNRYFH